MSVTATSRVATERGERYRKQLASQPLPGSSPRLLAALRLDDDLVCEGQGGERRVAR